MTLGCYIKNISKGSKNRNREMCEKDIPIIQVKTIFQMKLHNLGGKKWSASRYALKNRIS